MVVAEEVVATVPGCGSSSRIFKSGKAAAPASNILFLKKSRLEVMLNVFVFFLNIVKQVLK